MENMFLKSRITVVVLLAFSMFAVMGLHSCNKPPQIKDTKWEGSFVVTIDDYNPHEQEIVPNDYNVILTISFREKYANITARVSFFNFYLKEPMTLFRSGTAQNYTYEKGKISLEIEWKDEMMKQFDDGKWNGTVEKKTMTLENSSARIVTFTKKE